MQHVSFTYNVPHWRDQPVETEDQPFHRERPNATIKNTRIVINVSGLHFETYIETLEMFPNTLLGDPRMRSLYYDKEKRELFFNRNRSSFEHILYYYQSGGVIRCPSNIPIDVFIDELEFFYLNPELISQIREENMPKPKETDVMPSNNFQKKLWQLFEYPESSIYARIFAGWSIMVIIISIALFCVETLPDFASQDSLGAKTHQLREPYSTIFFNIETACIAWFTFELITRFLLCPRKCLFLRSMLNIIDLLSITPYFIAFATKNLNDSHANTIEIFRVIRLVRVFRIFKLTRHSKGLQILGQTLRASLHEMVMLGFFLGVIVILFSSAVYFAESHLPDSQFNSIPEAFWWAVVTITTVGYGDIRPVGLWGKIVGSLCAIAGVLTIALPVPVIVSNFNHFYRMETERKKIMHNKDSPEEEIPQQPPSRKLSRVYP